MGLLPYPKIFGSYLAIEARHFPLNNLLVLVLCTKPPQILRPSPAPVGGTTTSALALPGARFGNNCHAVAGVRPLP